MTTAPRTELVLASVLIILLVASGMCWSQESSSQKPASEIQDLTRALSGHWTLSVNWEPDGTTKGLVNSGEETWRPGPGGYTLIEEEQLQMHGQQDFLLGILWWDSASKSVKGMECQNLLPYTCDVKGARSDITMGWDGEQFVIDEIETSKSGQKSIWHETWSDITPTSFVQTGEYGPPGGSRKKLFTIHATRLADSKSKENLKAVGSDPHGANGPAPELQSLIQTLAGRWSTSYVFGSSQSGATGSGEEVWRPGPGGYVLMEEEHFKTPSEEVFLIALHWWDNNTNSLRGMLCNNSGPAACNLDTYSNSTLNWDGKQLTIDLQFSEHGKKMQWHEVWSDITTTSFTQAGDEGEVGGQLKRAVTIHGAKGAAHQPSSGN